MVVVFTVAGAAWGEAQDWAGWTATWENDSFVWGRGTDDLYTNGVRFALGRSPNRNFKKVDGLGRWWRRNHLLARSSRAHDISSSLLIGQILFTPTEITDFEVDPTDRPYAALLFAGIRMDVTEDAMERPTSFQVRFQHSVEADLGVMGPLAGSGTVQSSVHVLRKSRIPKGWPHQLPNEPALFATVSSRTRVGYHFADVVPHAGVMLGTPQTFAFGGGIARVGWNMSGFPALLIRPAAVPVEDRADWEAGAFIGWETRAFAYNGFVAGSLFRESPSVPSKDLVHDLQWGFTARLTDWRVTYTGVRRSPEMPRNGNFGGVRHRFGSVSFAYEPGSRTRSDRDGTFVGWLADDFLGRIFENLVFEASIGRGLSSGEGAGAEDSHAMHVAAGRRFGGRFAATLELTGMVREGDRPASPGAEHFDQFLVNRLVTARFTPFRTGPGPGTWQVRAGLGSALSKVQIIPGDPGPRPGPCPDGMTFDDKRRRFCSRSETGLGYLIGTGYGLALSKQASLNADLAWNRLNLEPSRSFVVWSVGVGWHP